MPRFDFQEFLTAVQKYRVSILPLVPPIVLGMVKHPAVRQFDLSSVRVVFSGAAPLGGEGQPGPAAEQLVALHFDDRFFGAQGKSARHQGLA